MWGMHKSCFGSIALALKRVLSPMGLEFDPAGLGVEWEGLQAIRESLRNGEPLVKLGKNKSPDSNIQECTENQDLLLPALSRLFCCLLPALSRLFVANLKLPSVPRLRPEIEIVYKMCQRQVDEDQTDDDAWDIRKMLRFVKRKASREDPSLES